MFNRLCIIGVGLIGGSIARVARSRNLAQSITGFGREQDLPNLKIAKRLGVVDSFSLDIAEAAAGADCVMIATPVGAIEAILALLKPVWNRDAAYTDVGSTKMNVFEAAQRIFKEIPANLVPAHPIAGAEQSGVEAAVDNLFENKRLIITPDNRTDPLTIKKIEQFWKRIGTQVAIMSAEHHDAILAATSHLPHLVAFALVDMLGHKDEQSEIFKYAASGFKDFTRIASSDPTMWLDICLANKHQILPLVEQLKDELSKIQQLLEAGDNRELFDTFTYARQARQRFLNLYDN